MRLITILASIIMISIKLCAQSFYTISAGSNIGKVVTKIQGQADKCVKSDFGYNLKVNAYIPLSTNTFIQSGLGYETVNSKVNTDYTNLIAGTTVRQIFKGKLWIGYVNIPLQVAYTKPIGKSKFFAGVGPIVGIGLAGKSKSTETKIVTIGSTSTQTVFNYNRKVYFGNADTAIKRINFGMGLQVSYATATNLVLSAYTTIGLSNINSETNNNTKTWSVGVTIGYLLKPKQ